MKTKKIKIFRMPSLLPALFGALVLAGCAQDEDINSPDAVHGQEVTITVNIPEAQIPSTRGIDGSGGEAKVTTIDVLVFDNNTPGVLLEHVKGTSISQSTTSTDDYKVQFLALLSANTNAKTVVLVANASTETDAAVAAVKLTGTVTKPKLLTALTFKSNNPGGTPDGWKWKSTSSSNYTPIPMYGEHTITTSSGITSGMKIDDVELTRMLARIDVVNNASNFTLTKVHVVNYNTAGYIAPAWNSADGALQSALPANPMIPVIPSNPQQLGTSSAMVYDYAALNTLNGGSGIYGDIYTYEAAATTGGTGHTNATCLILEGQYLGNTYFYRVDFTTASAAYMSLYRNHRYSVNITAVNGKGCATIGEALQSLGIMNNAKTELLVINENNIMSTVFNAQHYLGIGAREITFAQSPVNTTNIPCITNHGGGWQIDYSAGTNGIEYTTVGSINWLTAIKDPLGPANTADLQLTTLSTNETGTDRKATVYLRAGRLRHEIKVIQKGS